MPKNRARRSRGEKESLGFDVFSGQDSALALEKAKARELRATRWWKNQCAKGVCYYCNQSFPPSELTMDHIVPLAKGGKSVKNNVVPACKQCNTQKKHMLLMEWQNEP